MRPELQTPTLSPLVAGPAPVPLQLLTPQGELLTSTPLISDAQARDGLRAMLLGRRFDERCVQLQRRGLMVTLAPGIGQEACGVGSTLLLDRTRDWIVPQYREPAAQLHYGLPLVQAFLWHMGSPLGFVIHPGMKMLPFNAGVAGQIPHAVGLAWGFRIQKQDAAVVVHFGEGATSQGDFHESINLAGVTKAPVIFFCQNNQWAISTHASLQTASPSFAHKGLAYGVPGLLVDGNDLFAVAAAMRFALDRARRGEGATLIEGVTYRLGMHTTADDGARCEPPGMRDEWRPKDPLIRLQAYLERRQVLAAGEYDAMDRDIAAELDEAWQQAQSAVKNTVAESLHHVYAEMPPHLQAQLRAIEESRDA